MNQIWFYPNTIGRANSTKLNLHEQNQHPGNSRPLKNNFVLMKLSNLLLVVCITGLFISCEKSDSEKNNESKLLNVTCSFGEGIIDTVTKTVTIKAPESTDITQIIPQFDISENATIYPPSGVATDFSDPVTYTITSEDNSSKNVFTVIVIKPIIKFTVYDCSDWTPESFSVPKASATIKVYTNAENVGTTKTYDVLTTDEDAQAILYGLRTNNYYFTVEKDNKSNIVNGYVLLGTYNTQEEVDGSPDPDAQIGDLKFMDINGDGILNSDDNCNYQTISSSYLTDTNILLKDLYIAGTN